MSQIPNILIVGPSGSGKSSSLRNLDRSRTWINHLERKEFPFKNPKFKYEFPIPKEAKNENAWGILLKEFEKGMDEARKVANLKLIDLVVNESLAEWFSIRYQYCQDTQRGWDVIREYNREVLTLLNAYRDFPVPVVWTAQDAINEKETLVEGKSFRQQVCDCKGNEWIGKIEGKFTIVLFTHQSKDPKTGTGKYWFKTNNIGECTAKSPMGMFEEILIENDLAVVLKKIKEYYSAPAVQTKTVSQFQRKIK